MEADGNGKSVELIENDGGFSQNIIDQEEADMDMSLLQTKMKPATPLPELQTVEDIYRWIDENIAYGWQDKDGGTHTSEMKDFRRLYRTMSVTETLRQKIGTCIEQVALMHELLDAIGIPNQMYCCRIFEPDDYGILCEAARWKRESYHLFFRRAGRGIIPGVQRIYQPSGIGTEQCSETRAVASPEKGVCI